MLEIQVTCGGVDEADRLATTLVEQRLAACVQQLPIRSTYRWNGAVERDDELLLLVKTTRDRYAEVERVVLDLHSYDVPAMTAVEVVEGSAAYLEWVAAETR